MWIIPLLIACYRHFLVSAVVDWPPHWFWWPLYLCCHGCSRYQGLVAKATAQWLQWIIVWQLGICQSLKNYHTHPSAKQYNVKLSWWGSYLLWFVDLVPITCGYQKPTLQWTRLSGQNWWMDPKRGHVNQLGKELPSHSTTANAEVTLWRRARSTVEKLGTHCRHNHQTWDGRGFDIWVWLPESPIHKTNLDSDCWCHSIHDEDLMRSIVHNTLKFVTTNWATMTVHFTLLTGYIFVNYWAAYTEWVIISVHWLSNGNSKG